MRRPLALGLVLLLGACQANLAANVKVGTRTAASPAASPGARATGASPTAAPASKALAAPEKLVRPGGTSALAGRVTLDPAYVVGRSAGQVISNDGASVLAANAHLISNDGGGIITNDGGSIISNDGGSLISNDGGSIVASGGGNVIAPASLISNDGGGLITNDGGSLMTGGNSGTLITNDGAGRHLLADSGPGHAPQPAAGMGVYVRSLVDQKPVQLGTDKDGKPVFAIYTNLRGDYELYLPDAAKDNVEVVAFVPGKPDAKLRLDQITPPGVSGNAVDEDTSQIVKYIRMGFHPFAEAMLTGDTAKVAAMMKLDQFAGGEVYMQVLASLMAQVKANKIDKIPATLDGKENPQYAAVRDRLIDIVIAKTNFAAAKPSVGLVEIGNTYKPRHEDCLHLMADFFADRRVQAYEFFADPAALARLEGLPLVQEANKGRATPFKFERPSDYGDFLALQAVDSKYIDATFLLKAIKDFDKSTGLHDDGGSEWFAAAFEGVNYQLGLSLFLNADVQTELGKLFEGVRQP